MQVANTHLLVRTSKLPNNALSFPTHQFLEMVLLQMSVQQKKTWLKSLDSLNTSESTSKMHLNSPNTKQLPIETLIGTASNESGQPAFWQPQTSFPLLILLPSLSSCLLNFGLYITADRCFPRGDTNALAQSLSDSFQAVPHQASDRWAIGQVGKQLHLAQLQAFL